MLPTRAAGFDYIHGGESFDKDTLQKASKLPGFIKKYITTGKN